ncbi:MAG: aminoacyl-histidine dipeptidase [Ruminococcaceae bacterium]|nr:aminoacyl-histidine dipeptidase [Oscillospiraceae bacterium]
MENNRILSGLEPASVMAFFEDICAIPHVSGDEGRIADYIEAFARARGLSCYRDAVHNLFVKRPATEGHETAPAVMLQGHTDMVGEKTADSTHDFATDGLKLKVDTDGWISATDTTLGGDDGIAVAMMLAILDNPPEPHPAIECLFTVSEETGLEGAWAFDPVAAGATARTMINLDSEAEGIITAGCSGGMRTDILVHVTCEPAEGIAVKVTLDGFTGGHSGVEIHEGHTNAIKAMGRILGALTEAYDFALISLNGGGKDNAIPRDCTVTVALRDVNCAESFARAVDAEAALLRCEPNMIPADKTFTCTAEILPETPALCMDDKSTFAVLSLLTLVRDGVLSMSAHVKGLVAHSRNLGIVKTLADGEGKPSVVKLSMSTRSASNSHLDDSERELEVLAVAITSDGANATHRARYPGWDFAPVSPLRDLWTAVSEEMYGITPRVEVIHAGLECGILCDKLGEMDIISVGPDMRDIHTPREMLSAPSVERTYRLVCEVLRELS